MELIHSENVQLTARVAYKYLENQQNCDYLSKFGETNLRLSMNYQELQDIQLLLQIQQEDKWAFEEFYKRHWKVLYNTAFFKLRDEAAALDVLQEVFTWFWEHRHQASSIQNPRSYLIAAVKFKIANLIRHHKVRDTFFDNAGKVQPASYTQVQELEVKELKAIIEAFTENLPGKCRQVFRLSRTEQLSNREIAQQLSISEKTVENQLTIALRKLRLVLGRLRGQ